MIKAFTAGLVVIFLAALAPAGSTATKVIALGIAQDGGIPQIGCKQEVCRTQRHGVSSLAIVHDQSVYLIDASPDLRDQHRELIRKYPNLLKGNLFDAIFLTHAHMGHYAGLLYLGKESISTKQTPVYGSAEMAAYLKNNAPWRLLVENGNIDLRIFSSNQPVELGFKITPLSVPHRKEFTDTHGFLIQGANKSLLYIPDIDAWEPVKELLAHWLKKANFALLDGTFYSGKELPGRDMTKVPHPTIEHSIEFFKSFSDLKAAISFIHFNHTNPVLNPRSPEAEQVRKAGHYLVTDWQEFEL